MAEYLDKWPSKRGPISKIRPSDGCGRDAVPLAVGRWYDFPVFGGYLGNIGLLHSIGTVNALACSPMSATAFMTVEGAI